MPINPNIALGIQPVQQPNILGQMGQIMAIRAAQEDLEGGADVKNYFAKPAGERGDPTPLLGSKRGQAAYKAFNEGQEKQLDIAKKNVELVGAAAGAVLQNPTLENFSSVLSNLVQNRIYTPDQAQKALAAIGNDPSKIPAFVKPIFDQAVSAEKRLTDMTSRRGQDLSYSSAMAGVGATHRGQDLLEKRERDKMALTAQERSVIAGEGEFLQTDRYGNVYRVTSYGTMRGPNAPAQPLPPAAANAFVTTQPSVNALAPTAPPVVQPGSPTVANALAMEQQNNVPRPKQTTAPTLTEVEDPANPGQKLRVDARVYRGGTVGDQGVLGVARTENLTPAQKQKLKKDIGTDFDALNRVVGQTNELMESIDAVRSSSLEKVAGPMDARTPSLFKEAQVAETRFNNLKGKVTAIAKANASLGGAIGSIANQEWQILANQIAVLDLAGGKTANLEQIEQLERQAMSIVNRMRDGFERKYGADIETLAPQFKDVPNVNYTPGQYTATGRKSSGVDNKNPWLK